MNLDIYSQILKSVGQHYGTTLNPDANHSCIISIKGIVQIQLELDKSQHFLIVGANLGELPPGKFRELFLKEALRANGSPYPRYGTFAYSNRRSTLILFEKFPIDALEVNTLIEFLSPFTEKAREWKEAVKHGQPPSHQYGTHKGASSGMFGLRKP